MSSARSEGPTSEGANPASAAPTANPASAAPTTPTTPTTPIVAGVGIDMVHVSAFAEDLARPGSTFAESVFTVGERGAARRRGLTGHAGARFFAGRWAVKEAVVKAWSQALFGAPPPIARDDVDWRDIEVVADAWGRVSVVMHGDVRQAAASTLATGPGDPGGRFQVSISHDGEYAVAVAVLSVGG